MTDKPILFSAPMVRALLDGRKTQTRRVTKHQNKIISAKNGWLYPGKIPIDIGDRLWVKETFADLTKIHGRPWEKYNSWTDLYERGSDSFYWYRADGPQPGLGDDDGTEPWKPSIFMPRKASRITLTVTDVRIERLQDISRGDAMDEGCPFSNMAKGPNPYDWYRQLWNQINGAGAWEANPWVAAYTFDCRIGNIDEAQP